ncbi:bucentaur or craniofacial development-domain-containing protein [Kalaharituber pfeilii]|nr:bucentaur or craniofacial development-domain-containing protein [Kalaharituber pfeilii]
MATATADVNSLWETMNKPSWKKTPLRTSSENAESRISPTAEATSANDTTKQSLSSEPTPAPAPASTDNGTANATSISTFSSTGPSRPETIMKDGIPHINISHTYEFAGEIHTTNKLVPLDSAEAKLYLSSLSNSSPTANGGGAATENGDDKSADPPKRRPLKRTSAFDVPAASKKPNKLNTLEKSKLDWAGFVDQEGIKEDLERAGKGGGYLDRQAFLGRVEERREGVWREGRGGRR